MARSIKVLVVVCAFLGGCSSTLGVGLANAPWLDGDTAETHGYDVIANGADACQRSGFPQGDVLRGHIPACPAETRAPPTSDFLPDRAPPNAVLPWHRLGVCTGPGPGLSRSEMSLTGMSLSTPTVACEPPR